jgi:riboflavin biosynthesis pyrimidine reductase
LDGRASFRELPGQAGGREVSRSAEDRWLMDFFRAHHDAQMMGSSTLREEPGKDGLGWDFGVRDPELLEYRKTKLGREKTTVIILSASGNIDLRFNVFHSPLTEAWVLTTEGGAKTLKQGQRVSNSTKVLSFGAGPLIDVAPMMCWLRQEHGIRTLLCEGGPTLYSELMKKGLIDEDFRTVSAQVLGESSVVSLPRPTPYGPVSFVPETAPWYRIVSLHYALPYHLFLRLRYEGPRRF